MRPAARIAPQDWMAGGAVRGVMAALAAGGADARFVGGCVRDAVLGRRVRDVDIATPAPPERVAELLGRAGLKAVPTGLAHGTVTAVAEGRSFEITTLRRDIETFGRHARVEFTDDWQADAARRDFTMNAMSCTATGDVYDYFGGLADARAGRVRFVGEPRERIREDLLRLLRFFRIHAHYGRGDPDPEGLAACVELAPELPQLSAERVRDELLRLLQAPDPVPVLRLMSENGILAHVLPDARRFERLAALVGIEGDEPDPVRRLAAVLEVSPERAAAIGRALRLSSAEAARLVALAGSAQQALGDTPPEMRRALYRLGRDRFREFALLRAAEGEAGERLAARLAEAGRWEPRRLPLTGADAMALGVPRGPRIGRLLGSVERWWMEHDFLPGREACLARLRQLVAGGAV